MELPLIGLAGKNKTGIITGVIAFWLTIGGMIYLTEELIAAPYFGTKALDDIEKTQRQHHCIWHQQQHCQQRAVQRS